MWPSGRSWRPPPERAANKLVITSDNPRSESPETIIAQMAAGLTNPNRVQLQPDRAQAIADVVQQADSHDVVVIAGKGHEDYQDIAGIKHPFSDAAHAQAALQRRAERPQHDEFKRAQDCCIAAAYQPVW